MAIGRDHDLKLRRGTADLDNRVRVDRIRSVAARFFGRPAFADGKAVREPDEKNLDFAIHENGVPHPEPATENEILRHENSALEIKFHQGEAQAAVFNKTCRPPL